MILSLALGNEQAYWHVLADNFNRREFGMNRNTSYIVLAAMLVSIASPVVAGTVVGREDFEDDAAVTLTYPGLTGGPKNVGLPGTWHENQYVNNPWHDNLDADPDTNWQLQITKDLFPGSGNEAFYQNQHYPTEICPDFMPCGRAAPPDCPGDGSGNPAPCDNDRFSRDGFFQFATDDGTPRPAEIGDILKVGFDVRVYTGFAVFALTNDIPKMVAETGNTDLYPPLTKWNVGFGQNFNAYSLGLPRSRGRACGDNEAEYHENVISNLSFQSGINGYYFDTWGPGCDRIELTPDLNNAEESDNMHYAPPEFMNHLEFTYTVGNDFYDEMLLTYMDESGEVVTSEVRQEENDYFDDYGYRCEDDLDRCGEGNPVLIGGPWIFDEGAEKPIVDGIIFTDFRNSADAYRLDNICVVINGSLDECAFGGTPAPALMGDANKDGQVTGADLIAVQQSFGNVGASPLQGDANDDGQVTGSDLIAVQQNFGNVANPAAVPEPAATAIFVLAGLISLKRAKRHAIRYSKQL